MSGGGGRHRSCFSLNAVWYGIVWYGVVLVLYGMVLYCTRYDTINNRRHGMVRYATRYGATRRGARDRDSGGGRDGQGEKGRHQQKHKGSKRCRGNVASIDAPILLTFQCCQHKITSNFNYSIRKQNGPGRRHYSYCAERSNATQPPQQALRKHMLAPQKNKTASLASKTKTNKKTLLSLSQCAPSPPSGKVPSTKEDMATTSTAVTATPTRTNRLLTT